MLKKSRGNDGKKHHPLFLIELHPQNHLLVNAPLDKNVTPK
jgi:hypothetical protein